MSKSFEEFFRKEREARKINIRNSVEKVKSLMSKYEIEEITARYSGSGDDGNFYEIVSDECDLKRHPDLVEEVDELGRLLLSQHYEGWEISNGSQGAIHLSLQDNKLDALIEHAWLEYVEQPPIYPLSAEMFDEPKNTREDVPPDNTP